MVRYSEEPFLSVQGEGKYTGELCTWLRLFACNLSCAGFSQPDPSDPNTYIKPINFNPKDIKRLEDIPTPKYGCDSAYSVSAQYKHLAKKDDFATVANKVIETLPFGLFHHPNKPNRIGHVFTGGEPLLQQKAIIGVVREWLNQNNYPHRITFETNGTQLLSTEFINEVGMWKLRGIEVVFSISPKLLHVSGEKPEKAINIEAIETMKQVGTHTYLKFVLNEDERAWRQAEDVVKLLHNDIEVWAMPVGGVYEQQNNPSVAKLADKAIFEYGWNISNRTHIILWGNDQMGR